MKNKTDIIWLDEVDSTNNEAKRRLPDVDNLSVLSAKSQTSGRGQRGNTWSSDPGMNLTFSIVLKYDMMENFRIQAYDQFSISQLTSLAVVDFLSKRGISAMIKWPNDIYVGNRKICGILIENSVRGIYLSSSIIGIGLNINQRNFNVTQIIPTSTAIETDKDEDIHASLEEFMDIFKLYMRRYLHINGGLGKLRKMYLSMMWRKDQMRTYKDLVTGTEFIGIIRGVSDLGHLQIETEKGELLEFAFKEIGYVL